LFSGHDSAWARASRRVGWAASLVLVLLLGQSALSTGHVPWPLKILVVAVAVLAAIRPGHALVIVAGLAPLGHVMVTSIPGAYDGAARLVATCGGVGVVPKATL